MLLDVALVQPNPVSSISVVVADHFEACRLDPFLGDIGSLDARFDANGILLGFEEDEVVGWPSFSSPM